ncbi:hypothetical protein GCM10020219_065560 [Nonomuraea dietziae]
MAFHFPLRPRIYMAVKKETREPISEIMSRTPKLPENAQWGIFLRNHDELTLETVDRGRARLHARGVRQGPAHARLPRHQAASGAVARQRP